MTTTDPFTTPAEAERDARVKQARDRLDAATAHISVYASNAPSLNYVDSARAVRDALVGQGHAMLAVRDELADIAASLRTLAAMPSAVANVALAVTAVQETLTELGNDVCDMHTAIEEQTKAAVDAGDSQTDAVRDLIDVIDRPRWWQVRRRWTLRRQQNHILDHADVHEYLIEVRQVCPPWESASSEVLGRARFYAVPHAACSTADTMLPGLYAQLGADTNPDRVHGLVYQCNPDGPGDGYVGIVFLPESAALDIPDGATPIT